MLDKKWKNKIIEYNIERNKQVDRLIEENEKFVNELIEENERLMEEIRKSIKEIK